MHGSKGQMAVRFGQAFRARIFASLLILILTFNLAVQSSARCQKRVVLQCVSLHTIGLRQNLFEH